MYRQHQISKLFHLFIFFIALPVAAFPQSGTENKTSPALSVFDQLQENVWYLPTADGMAELYVTSIGRGDTVVTLHGGPGNDFHYLVDAIKGNLNHNTFILFDQRGSLLSPVAHSKVGELTLNLLVEDLETLRKTLKQDQMILFGHSFGSLLALSYYIKYPRHVKGLVLSATMPPCITKKKPFSGILEEIHARLKKLRTRDEVKKILKKEGLNGPIENLSYQEKSDRFKITGLASFNMMDLENWEEFIGGNIYYNRKVDSAISSSIPANYDIRPALNNHSIPITIIQGDKDYIDPAAQYWSDIIKAYDSIKLTVVNNASHYSWYDNQKQFNNHLHQALLRIKK